MAVLSLIVIYFISNYSYPQLGITNVADFMNSYVVLDDYYNTLYENITTDLIGVFTILYITNSLLLVIVGVLLLVASIVCVVLVSFFTKNRNFNNSIFVDIFTIAKSCYSFVFLRKQNLAKQGRTVTSTRLFSKKRFDATHHKDYQAKNDGNINTSDSVK